MYQLIPSTPAGYATLSASARTTTGFAQRTALSMLLRSATLADTSCQHTGHLPWRAGTEGDRSRPVDTGLSSVPRKRRRQVGGRRRHCRRQRAEAAPSIGGRLPLVPSPSCTAGNRAHGSPIPAGTSDYPTAVPFLNGLCPPRCSRQCHGASPCHVLRNCHLDVPSRSSSPTLPCPVRRRCRSDLARHAASSQRVASTACATARSGVGTTPYQGARR